MSNDISDESTKVQIEKDSKQNRKINHNKHTQKVVSEQSQSTKDYNGFIAEDIVYHTILKRIKGSGSVGWDSGNAQKAGIKGKCDDTLGYDIRYSDADEKEHYVEVKGTSSKFSSDIIEFNLTKNEYEFADKKKDAYELWFVFIDKDNKTHKVIEFGNIMKFENNESFFNNSKFSVEQSEFKIRAKIKGIINNPR